MMMSLLSHCLENSGVIDGVKYDRVLLEKAEGVAEGNSGPMNLGDVAALWDDASSDGTSTDILGMLGDWVAGTTARSAKGASDQRRQILTPMCTV